MNNTPPMSRRSSFLGSLSRRSRTSSIASDPGLSRRSSESIAPTLTRQRSATESELLPGRRHLIEVKHEWVPSEKWLPSIGVSVADTLLKDAIVSFQQENQSVTPKFQVDYWYELREALLRDDISFFIAANHEFVEDRELSTEDLYVSEICFHARKNHPLTKKKIVRCADLVNYPLLTYRTLIAKKRVKERLTTEKQLRAFQKNFEAGTLNSMQGTPSFIEATDYLAMTERGFYDSQSPTSQIQELEIEDFRLKLQIKICWRAKHVLSAREHDLIDCFKNAAAARALP